MQEEFYTFIVTSTINTTHSPFSSHERFLQTKETILSIKKKISNVRIILIDNSNPELSIEYQQYFQENTNLFIKYKHNLFSEFINKTCFNKGLGELFLTKEALDTIVDTNLVGKMIFKISGRYVLTDDFNIDKFIRSTGKYNFKITAWAISQDNDYKNSVYEYYLETRLYGFCSSLLKDYRDTIYNVFEYMLLNNKNLETSLFNVIPHSLIVETNPIGVEGTFSTNNGFIKD